ncbi:hypothetical protein [Streptomyces huiliensis]|uniref:hypothetical protein n=1 Tax=Streptomyces huiliensis TaxID=2876027 RepID=UPI001CBCCEA2|nr:hypothetical protein [Streptomyces huiliensis]MBZ4322820.1 hypothetical protein [Streptomyces huiliensis]
MASTTTSTPSAAPATGRFRRLYRRIDRQLGGRDERWAKGPAVVSLLAVPALLWYAFGGEFLIVDDGPLAALLFAGALALAVAWLLPHRESMRSARLTFTVTAAVTLLLPIVLTVVMVVFVVLAAGLA